MAKLIPHKVMKSSGAYWIETTCGQHICHTYYQADRPGSIVTGISESEAKEIVVSVARFLRDGQ